MTKHRNRNTEETIRIDVAQRLAGQLASADRMLAVCEKLADLYGGDCIMAMVAASRLLRADAQVALGIARMIQLETRHRSITERPELNSKKIEPPVDEAEKARRFDERMNRLVEAFGRENEEGE
jgi:hypothetical protein